LGRPFENCSEVAVQCGGDLAAPGAGRKRDAFDERANGVRGLIPFPRVLKRFGEALHLAAVEAADVRVNVRDRDGVARQAFRQFVLLRLQLAKAGHE
jgi:hypothetical protein